MPKKFTAVGGSHFDLTEAGPYLFPDLVRYERIDRVRRTYIWIVHARATGQEQIYVPISNEAMACLITAAKKEVPFETSTGCWPLALDEMADPIEMPLLNRFVCFRAIEPEWRVCEFLNENGQRLLVSFSSETYAQFLVAIKRIRLTTIQAKNRAIPAQYFAGKKVILEGKFFDGTPCCKEKLSDQQAAEMMAKQEAYVPGIEPRKVLWVWDKLKGCESRETAKRLWSRLGVDIDAPRRNRSEPTTEKFLRRLHVGHKVKFTFMRQCPVCEGYFSTENRKTEFCSDACKGAVAEQHRPDGYHADYQRVHRAVIRAKDSRLAVPKTMPEKRCGFCGNKHTRKSSFCTPRCEKRYAVLVVSKVNRSAG